MRPARMQHPFSRPTCPRVWALVQRVVAGVAFALGIHGDTVAIVTGDRVNLRGRPTLSSEVVTQVLEGETVVVLDSLLLSPSRRGEVAQWHRIRLPEDTPVWVHAGFIDRTTRTVTASRLNVRAGPGDRYSVLGHLAKGESVREIRIVDDWMEIEPPSGTYAYMAASYAALQPAPASAAQPHIAQTAPAATLPPVELPVAASPDSAREAPVASMNQPTPQAPPSAPAPDVQVPTMTAAVPDALQTPAREPQPEPVERPHAALAPGTVPRPEGRGGPMPGKPVPAAPAAVPAVPWSARLTDPLWTPRAASIAPASGSHRIVQREGILLDAMHIQAPAGYKLRSWETGRDINFVTPASAEVQLALYRGQRVIITGEERSAPGWPNQPIFEARTIQLAP